MLTRRSPLVTILGVAAVLFGLVTIGAGADVLFFAGASRAGPIVPFVLWFNFAAGFVYVAAGVGLVLRRRWSASLALLLAVGTLAVALAFAAHVALGRAFATRTAFALSIRCAFWAFVAHRARSETTRGRGRGARDDRA